MANRSRSLMQLSSVSYTSPEVIQHSIFVQFDDSEIHQIVAFVYERQTNPLTSPENFHSVPFVAEPFFSSESGGRFECYHCHHSICSRKGIVLVSLPARDFNHVNFCASFPSFVTLSSAPATVIEAF